MPTIPVLFSDIPLSTHAVAEGAAPGDRRECILMCQAKVSERKVEIVRTHTAVVKAEERSKKAVVFVVEEELAERLMVGEEVEDGAADDRSPAHMDCWSRC